MEHNPWGHDSSSGFNGRRFGFSWKVGMAFGWVAFLILLCLFVVWHKVSTGSANLTTIPDTDISVDSIPLPALGSADQLAASTSDRMLEVNGRLKVNNSLILSPSSPPKNPVKGQVYYDETTNAPMYYDGEKFFAVARQDDIDILRSSAGQRQVVVEQTVNNTTGTIESSEDVASGIVCLQNSTSCGFVTGTPANFIQNQNSGAQAGSTYWVGGVGRADGGLIAPSIDVAGGGVLSIGGDASAVAINDDTTINGALDVAVNSASVNSPLLQLTQNGSGDSTIELQNASGSSFYLGMDESAGGVLRIGSSTAARTTNSIGSTSSGGVAFENVESQIIAKKLVTGPADEGTLASISVYLSSVDGAAAGVKVGIYAHDTANNRPGTLLAATSTATLGSVGWNAIPLSAPISNNTTYWVAVNIEGSGTGLGFDYCGGCAGESTSTYPRAFNNAWPAVHGPPNNFMDSYEWSMYMDVASGGVNDTYAGAKLFSMTATGALTLQNSIDTTSAFVIQNANADEILRADTTTMKLTVRELDVTYNLAVGGDVSFGRHLRSGGSSPATTTEPAACTSPTVTVSGTDTSGMVTVVAGTGCATDGAIMAVVFANTFANVPKVTLTPATATAASLPAYVDHAQVTTTSFDIATSTPLADGVTYRWYYHAIE